MLKEFEKGKEYRLLKWDELVKREGVITDDICEGNPILKNKEGFQYYTKWMEEIKDRIFKSYETKSIFYLSDPLTNSKWHIETWMCEEVELDENLQTKETFPTKEEKHILICSELNTLYVAKNHDYGDSFGETFKTLGLVSAVTRITDKVNRLQSLCTKQQKVQDESIKDTLMDTANYCIMTLIELENNKGE